MESNIRQLLTANGATHLPAPTDVADRTPTNQITQETYLGYSESSPQYFVGTAVVHDKAVDYHAPSSIPLNDLAFNGTWTDRSQQATAGANAALVPALHRRRRLSRPGWERVRSTSRSTAVTSPPSR